MLIHELSKKESIEVLAHTHLGRLACASGMQPYVVPIHFAFQGDWLYSFSVPGQKIDWMRANPQVCVEADQMRREHWATVVVSGRFEELHDTPEFRSERTLAFDLLQRRTTWWEPAGAKKMPDDALATAPIFYRIRIEQITGRCALSEQDLPYARSAAAEPDDPAWLHDIFERVRHHAGR